MLCAVNDADLWFYHCDMANVELTPCQWSKILPFLRSRSDLYVGRETHCCRCVAGVLWIARSGTPLAFPAPGIRQLEHHLQALCRLV